MIVLAAGFMVYMPSTAVGYVSVPVASTSQDTFATSSLVATVNTVEDTFTTSSTTSVSVSQSTNATQPLFMESDSLLATNHYDFYYASLTVGTDADVSWSASEAVNVYVFNSSEFSAFTSSGQTGPSFATGSAANGTLDFRVSGTDTYYLVIQNEYSSWTCVSGVCARGANIRYTTSGSETYPKWTTTFMTSTVTYTTSTPMVVTSTSTVTYTTSTQTVVTLTSTSTTTSTCSHALWSWIGGAKGCP
ncbi:MAG: hypothetical protein OK442_05415 [Thaumarchaeota archaeon]|nr:hypothetical protein [Nitrososphaerota archaeon]